MTKSAHAAFTGLAIIAALATTPAWAEMMSFKADLKGASEVPPVTSQGTKSVTATYDTVGKKLTWKGTVSGLSGAGTAAHFHGSAEGVMIPALGVTSGPFEGSATLTDDQAKALIAGQTYFNVHTAANPNGEMRGQATIGQ